MISLVDDINNWNHLHTCLVLTSVNMMRLVLNNMEENTFDIFSTILPLSRCILFVYRI